MAKSLNCTDNENVECGTVITNKQTNKTPSKAKRRIIVDGYILDGDCSEVKRKSRVIEDMNIPIRYMDISIEYKFKLCSSQVIL